MGTTEKQAFSIIVPVYNNEQNIPVSVPYMIEASDQFRGYDVEFIFVCDGSPDCSFEELRKMKDRYQEKITIINFTRNFTQGAAVHCGIDHSRGNVIGVISCDMQDPFELFSDMLSEWENGYKLVIANRESRHDKGLGVLGSNLYHHLVHRYIDKRWPAGGFDFFLMDRQVAQDYAKYDVANGSMQMLLIWLGYEYKLIPYTREERYVGHSGYSFFKKLNLVFGVFATYSPIMSRIWLAIGALLVVLSAVLAVVFACAGLFTATGVNSALPSLLLVFCAGIVLCAIGFMGEFIWRDYRNSLGLPRYVIDEIE